jgi:hypothetical protein
VKGPRKERAKKRPKKGGLSPSYQQLRGVHALPAFATSPRLPLWIDADHKADARVRAIRFRS